MISLLVCCLLKSSDVEKASINKDMAAAPGHSVKFDFLLPLEVTFDGSLQYHPENMIKPLKICFSARDKPTVRLLKPGQN